MYVILYDEKLYDMVIHEEKKEADCALRKIIHDTACSEFAERYGFSGMTVSDLASILMDHYDEMNDFKRNLAKRYRVSKFVIEKG